METTDWTALAPHHERDALLICAPELVMSAAADAITADRAAVVQHWLSSGLLFKPGFDLVETWADSNPAFSFVIVQPFVLAQVQQQASGRSSD